MTTKMKTIATAAPISRYSREDPLVPAVRPLATATTSTEYAADKLHMYIHTHL